MVELKLTGWRGLAYKSGVKDELEFYRNHAKFADEYWQDSDRPDFQADIWYNRNRNRITLDMLAPLNPARVLSVGGRGWVERALLGELPGDHVITDLVDTPGLVQADAEDLPFPDSSFDLVICRDVLEHVPDTGKAMNEARRVLKQGGHYFVSTPNGYNVSPDGTLHVRVYTPDSLIREIEGHGFRVANKRGDAPNILSALMPLYKMGFSHVLGDYQDIQKMQDSSPVSYYTGTFMYLLAVKP